MTDEPDPYYPPSDFLMLLIDDEATLGGSAFGDANLARLIGLTRDPDPANRDWAVLLLSQTPFDTPAIRAALHVAFGDPVEDVRLEALVGLAKREPGFALPHVLALFDRETIAPPAVEAAVYVADARLLPGLRDLAAEDGFDEGLFGAFLEEAIDSCTTGVQPDWRSD